MSKHTPGPWHTEEGEIGNWIIWIADHERQPGDDPAEDEGYTTLATVWDNVPPKEMRANALLLGAAPDLLAFCEKMEADTWFLLLSDDLANMLRAALAKARGEEE